jgi:hypothetical protein
MTRAMSAVEGRARLSTDVCLMAVHDPFSDIGRERPARQPLGSSARFTLYCARFQLLDEHIRRSKSCIGNVFPARDEMASVPGNQNDSSHDD